MQFFNKIRKNETAYAAIIVILAFVYNIVLYSGSRLLTAGRPHISMETDLDRMVPFVPWMILIYLGCYAFWAVNYLIVVKGDKRKARQFLYAHFLGEAIGFLFFVFLPTTMYRPVPEGKTLLEALIRFVYSMDPADNLFPSFHCFVSWMCWIGVRKNASVPRWYRHTSLLLAMLVFVTVLTVKQHVIADVFSGIILAEASYQVMRKLYHG